MAEDKGHKPTPKRIREARKEGKVLKSQVITQAGSIFLPLLVAILLARLSWVEFRTLVNFSITSGGSIPEWCLARWAELILYNVLIFLSLCAGISILLEGFQVGVHFEFAILKLRPKRINFVSGLRGLVSGLASVWLVLLKVISLLALTLWLSLRLPKQVLPLFFSSSAGQVSLIQLMVLEFVAASGVLFVLLGGIDYLYRKHQYYRELSMSTDEVRREFRETEGDPHFKAERSAIHEELLAQDVATRIRKCKVVLVKTH